MNEIWKDIINYEGLYKISNLGRVKSLDRKTKTTQSNTGFKIIKGKMLLARQGKDGYYRILLAKNGKSKNYLVHRLIGAMFIPNPNKKLCINHIDGNRANNDINNLEWSTHIENEKHSYAQLGRKPSYGTQGKKGKLCKCSKPVICSNGKRYDSITHAANELNLHGTLISRVLIGKTSHTGGYIFKYA